MGVLSWIVLGLVAGLLAKIILPGKDPGGAIVTILIGIVGAVIGGFIGTRLGWGEVTGLDLRSIVLSIGGAIVLLCGLRVLKRLSPPGS
jgi:uncharacterized membrane protein YeaQ/YmgE (transglycosylase-associated protein family)